VIADKYIDGQAAEKREDHLVVMNDRFAVVKVGGKTRVLSLERSPIHRGWLVPTYSTFTDFRNFHHRVIMWGGREIGIAAWWIKQEERRQYEGVTNQPGIETPGYFNLWRGFAVKPRAGDCSLFLAHILDNVSKGNKEH